MLKPLQNLRRERSGTALTYVCNLRVRGHPHLPERVERGGGLGGEPHVQAGDE